MSVFEDLFTVAKEKDTGREILQELKEIKQLMIPKVVYVPVYIEQKPWWFCEPYYTIDYTEHACLGSYCVST